MTFTSLIFPGQGSQEIGMGRDIAEQFPEVMDLWKKAERISGIALREIYWDGDEEQMPLTQNLQPALTAANISVWMVLSKQLRPLCTAGHSLGEFSSFAAANVLPAEAILELVSLRGQFMSQADPQKNGAMAAVLKMSLEQVSACVDTVAKGTGETIVIANYNTPGQYVISGTKSAIEAAKVYIKEEKGRAVSLPVSGAFHSPLMDEAANEFAKAISSLSKGLWNNAKFPVYCNASAKGETDTNVLKNLLLRQMTSPVFWIDTIRNQQGNGAKLFVECGPKTVLSKMITPILANTPTDSIESLSIGTLKNIVDFSS